MGSDAPPPAGGTVGTGGNKGTGGNNGTGGSPATGSGGWGNDGTGGAPAGTGGSGTGGHGLDGSGGSGTGGVPGSGGVGPGGRGGTAGTVDGTGGRGVGGEASGGRSGTGGSSGTGGTGVGGTPGISTEDEGADCAVPTLPDAGALTAVAKLPDPFKKLDGMRLATKSEWRCRRAEIKKQAEKYIYGEKPARSQSVTGAVTNSSIMVKVMNDTKSSSFSAPIVLPGSGSAPYPAIIVYGGTGFGAPLDSGVIRDEGVALINYDPYAVGKEGTSRTNKQGAFYELYGNTSPTGLLGAWAWGISRIIDVIAQSGGSIIKADAIGVTGCSRFGKGSFVAGVFDQRVALTMPVEAGSGGQAALRGIAMYGGQSLSSTYDEQPWLGDAFMPFINKVNSLPIDTHQMVAMIAPRGLFMMDNPHIDHLSPKSGHLAALGGAEVYKALGAGDNISYYSDVQSGTHCSQRPEWVAPLRSNVKKFLTRTGNDPGVFKPAAKASANLTEWRDWTTPTLN